MENITVGRDSIEEEVKIMETGRCCPFCEFDSVCVIGEKKDPIKSPNAKGFQAECINCGARGPMGYIDEKNAIEAWVKGDYPKRSDIDPDFGRKEV